MTRPVKIEVETELHLTHLRGFFVRTVTPFGNSAKVDCPKEFLGKTVYLVIVDAAHKD